MALDITTRLLLASDKADDYALLVDALYEIECLRTKLGIRQFRASEVLMRADEKEQEKG